MPYAGEVKAPELIIKDEPAQFAWSAVKPRVLLASPHNHGAVAVARKLASTATNGSLAVPSDEELQIISTRLTVSLNRHGSFHKLKRLASRALKHTTSTTHVDVSQEQIVPRRSVARQLAKRVAQTVHQVSLRSSSYQPAGQPAGDAIHHEKHSSINSSKAAFLLQNSDAIFLLYLNHMTFAGLEGGKLAIELRALRKHYSAVTVLMVHERDEELGGCEFDYFLAVTPRDLVIDGLYSDIAQPLYPGRHAPTSYATVFKSMGLHRRQVRRNRELATRAAPSSRRSLTEADSERSISESLMAFGRSLSDSFKSIGVIVSSPVSSQTDERQPAHTGSAAGSEASAGDSMKRSGGWIHAVGLAGRLWKRISNRDARKLDFEQELCINDKLLLEMTLDEAGPSHSGSKPQAALMASLLATETQHAIILQSLRRGTCARRFRARLQSGIMQDPVADLQHTRSMTEPVTTDCAAQPSRKTVQLVLPAAMNVGAHAAAVLQKNSTAVVHTSAKLGGSACAMAKDPRRVTVVATRMSTHMVQIGQQALKGGADVLMRATSDGIIGSATDGSPGARLERSRNLPQSSSTSTLGQTGAHMVEHLAEPTVAAVKQPATAMLEARNPMANVAVPQSQMWSCEKHAMPAAIAPSSPGIPAEAASQVHLELMHACAHTPPDSPSEAEELTI